ncbi:hypothetical protein JCM11641_003044 [Rhodosporidiobolus odoratus]
MDESPLNFVDRWTEELRSLQAAALGNSPPTSDVSEAVQSLSQQLTGRTSDIPLSELRRCERELKALQDSLKSQAAPKSKFSFKRSAASCSATPKPTSAPPPSVVSIAAPSKHSEPQSIPPTGPAPSPPAVPPNSLTLSSHSSTYLSYANVPLTTSAALPSSSAGSALVLSSLRACLVDLLPPVTPSETDKADEQRTFSASYLTDMQDSVILLPVISGSILIHGCKRCVLVLGGHQFRMHDSSDCTILLRAGSTPIIERCQQLVFGAYPTLFSLSAPPPVEPPAFVQDFDDPFATPERPSSNWCYALADRAALFDSDERWKRMEARREAWRDLLEASLER